jgi:hypothetical protein
MPSVELIRAIAVTAELCGRTFSAEAAAVFVDDLAPYPEFQVMKALVRCRKEVRGVLTLQDVVSRLDDGRPGAEEAWAMLPLSESQTAVWTLEMSEAFGIALPLIGAGEVVAARMAFKETYQRLVSQARDAGRAVCWSATLGHDANARESVLLQAVSAGRLTLAEARSHCPELPAPHPDVLALVFGPAKLAA